MLDSLDFPFVSNHSAYALKLLVFHVKAFCVQCRHKRFTPYCLPDNNSIRSFSLHRLKSVFRFFFVQRHRVLLLLFVLSTDHDASIRTEDATYELSVTNIRESSNMCVHIYCINFVSFFRLFVHISPGTTRFA